MRLAPARPLPTSNDRGRKGDEPWTLSWSAFATSGVRNDTVVACVRVAGKRTAPPAPRPRYTVGQVLITACINSPDAHGFPSICPATRA